MHDAVASPSIEQVLDAFVRESVIARHPATVGTVRGTRTRLASYLANDAAQVLTAEQRALLEAEQQFDQQGAATRIFGPEVLAAALPGFLSTTRPRLSGREALAQIVVVEALSDWVASRGLVGTADSGNMRSTVVRIAEAALAARAELEAAGHPVLPGLEDYLPGHGSGEPVRQ